MKIGMVGAGKLGLPVAVCMSAKHDVDVYDINPKRMSYTQDYVEAGPDGAGDFNDYLGQSSVNFTDLKTAVNGKDIVFVAVQTPHEPEFEGITALPEERRDFDYTYLQNALDSISQAVEGRALVVIISTVLPGTIRRFRYPNLAIGYNPYFIAMGTVMKDFLNPEFILYGGAGADTAKKLYDSLVDAPMKVMRIESAELAKVAYNTFISTKLAFVNTLAQVCDVTEADVDEVTDALCAATDRLISPKYMKAGMGDGGGCHPRDNIALSWFAREYALSYDFFESIMVSREEHARWLAGKMKSYALPKFILGTAFKPETEIETGSHALLVKNLLEEDGIEVETGEHSTPKRVSVVLVGCNRPEYRNYRFPIGSVVLDPWGYIPEHVGVKVIRLGRQS